MRDVHVLAANDDLPQDPTTQSSEYIIGFDVTTIQAPTNILPKGARLQTSTQPRGDQCRVWRICASSVLARRTPSSTHPITSSLLHAVLPLNAAICVSRTLFGPSPHPPAQAGYEIRVHGHTSYARCAGVRSRCTLAGGDENIDCCYPFVLCATSFDDCTCEDVVEHTAAGPVNE